MNKIVVIGDSHSQLFDNNPILKRGNWSDSELNIFDVRWLGPVTYWRLCRDMKNFIDFNKDIIYEPHIGFKTTTLVDKSTDIMISLGEIDIRSHISKYESQKRCLDDMIISIDNFLNEFSEYKIHLISIIPPIKKEDCISYNESFPFIGSDYDRLNNTLYFNDNLRKLSLKYNFGYFDIYSLYKNSEGFLDLKKSDNIIHAIKTIELENYIKKYFNL